MNSKAFYVRELLEEYVRDGKDISSNKDLAAELKRRHPTVNLTVGDVAQNKAKWQAKNQPDDPEKEAPLFPDKPAVASVVDTPLSTPLPSSSSTVFIEQLRALCEMIGKEAVKRLIDTL